MALFSLSAYIIRVSFHRRKKRFWEVFLLYNILQIYEIECFILSCPCTTCTYSHTPHPHCSSPWIHHAPPTVSFRTTSWKLQAVPATRGPLYLLFLLTQNVPSPSINITHSLNSNSHYSINFTACHKLWKNICNNILNERLIPRI